ncbi:hypothetical protein WNB94_16940 [Aquabacterium sp. A3]|uniref:hypothetical protein n=1 Tax=Aquabacterium sp. A3 TaxID=3132829 RepID=UPI00311A8A04
MGGLDPSLIVTAISAILQATQTWYAHKDARQAAEELDKIIGSGADDPELVEAMAQLHSFVPAEVIDALLARIEQQWVRYAEVLEAPPGAFTEAEIDAATQAAKAGVCRELQRLRSITGALPPGKLSQWWELYKCP